MSRDYVQGKEDRQEEGEVPIISCGTSELAPHPDDRHLDVELQSYAVGGATATVSSPGPFL